MTKFLSVSILLHFCLWADDHIYCLWADDHTFVFDNMTTFL